MLSSTITRILNTSWERGSRERHSVGMITNVRREQKKRVNDMNLRHSHSKNCDVEYFIVWPWLVQDKARARGERKVRWLYAWSVSHNAALNNARCYPCLVGVDTCAWAPTYYIHHVFYLHSSSSSSCFYLIHFTLSAIVCFLVPAIKWNAEWVVNTRYSVAVRTE